MKFPHTSTSVSGVFSKLRVLALNQTEVTWTEVRTFPGFVSIYTVRFLSQVGLVSSEDPGNQK